MSLKRYSFLNSFFSASIGFAFNFALFKIYPLSDYGILLAIISILQILVVLCDLGIQSSWLNILSFCSGPKKKYMSTVIYLRYRAYSILVLAFILIIPLTHVFPVSVIDVFSVCLSYYVPSVLPIILALSLSLVDLKSHFKFNIIVRTSQFVLLALLASLQLSIFKTYSLACLLSLALILSICKNPTAISCPSLKLFLHNLKIFVKLPSIFEFRYIKTNIKKSLSLFPSVMADSFLMKSDAAILATFSTPDQAALYAFAYQFYSFMSIFTTLPSQLLRRSILERGISKLRLIANIFLCTILAFTACAFLILSFPSIVNFIKPSAASASSILFVLAFAIIPLTIEKILQGVFQAFCLYKKLSLILSVAAFCYIIMAVLSAKLAGAYGVALVTFVTELSVSLALAYYLFRNPTLFVRSSP